MEPDYPAAHSMDTRWFAVDRDGHVACFYSGEAGAVPERAGEVGTAWDETVTLLPRVGAAHDRRGRICPGPEAPTERHHSRGLVNLGVEVHLDFGDVTVLFLDSLDAVRAELDAGTATVLPTTEGVAVAFRQLSEEVHRRLHDSGACRGCFHLWRGLGEEDLPSLGLFRYDHLTENWISGPYGRTRVPLRPLHVDQLPPQLRDLVKRVRFDIRFAESQHIQPVEHGKCNSWESAWLDVTGTHIRPIPGREEDYGEAYAELHGLTNHLDVQPPPGASGDAEK
jgi:hypothetical protein